jgi:regulatory protein
MAKITRLVKGKGRDKRVRVYLDGRYACTLLAEVVLKEGLRVGQELTPDRLESLTSKDRCQRCLNLALRYLGYRPRSEAEIKEHLRRHGYDSACAEKTLAQLKRQGLVDDAAFARYWKENRETFRPRSRRLTGMELRRKGLDSDIIAQVTGEIDDRASAYRAALPKARRLATSEYDDFRRRLGEYLGRRGFNYDVINDTVKKIWQERSSAGGRFPDGEYEMTISRHRSTVPAREY